jgi:hypothetical protein
MARDRPAWFLARSIFVSEGERPPNVTETGFERVARQGRLPAWISSVYGRTDRPPQQIGDCASPLARCPSNGRGKLIADPNRQDRPPVRHVAIAWPCEAGLPAFERIEAGGCARIVVSRHPASISRKRSPSEDRPAPATSRRCSGVSRAARAVSPRLSSSAAALLIYRREFARFNDK